MMENDGERVLDFTTIAKLKEVEQGLKKEIEQRHKELVDIMNTRDEYIVHLLRILLSKVDAMDSSSEKIARTVTHAIVETSKKKKGLFKVKRSTSWDRLLKSI